MPELLGPVGIGLRVALGPVGIDEVVGVSDEGKRGPVGI
jgi:hypothetical protein